MSCGDNACQTEAPYAERGDFFNVLEHCFGNGNLIVALAPELELSLMFPSSTHPPMRGRLRNGQD